MRAPKTRNLSFNRRRFRQPGDPIFTLTTSDRSGVWYRDQIRELTPLEWERLQGFPDHWTRLGQDVHGQVVPVSNTRRYKALGNAVTVPVIRWLASRLKWVMENE
ncbi:DNA cytosine methyltransferase [Sulfidibacter corallicola]|uniref:DNA cytosine methyltransferase n=1 Tax=Sulfidibacter corallicola TaxID=2818388 RepID=UPI003B2187D8